MNDTQRKVLRDWCDAQYERDIARTKNPFCYGAIGGAFNYVFQDGKLVVCNKLSGDTIDMGQAEMFKLDETQQAKLDAWEDKGPYIYTFIPTSIALILNVTSVTTGAELDLNDYENW